MTVADVRQLPNTVNLTYPRWAKLFFRCLILLKHEYLVK
jgi:hypothetical protein